jgi:uncharacterized membrane protein
LTGDFGRQVIDVVYPPLGTSCGVADPTNKFRQLPVTQNLVYSGPPRPLQSLDVPALLALAEQSESVIEMVCAVGDTLLESTPMLRVYGGRDAISERALRKAIQTGMERTFEQDPKYSIRLVVDIAIRALSPAVNDPTTAVQALDQIEDLLVRLGRRCLEIGKICGGDGSLRLVIPVPSWEDLLELAFSQIRVYGASSAQVMRRMKAMMSDLADALPEERLPALRHEQKRLDNTIARTFPDIEDRLEASIEDREGLGTPRRRQAGAPD